MKKKEEEMTEDEKRDEEEMRALNNGPTSDENRSCHDILCCLLFIAFIAGCAVITGIGFKNGNDADNTNHQDSLTAETVKIPNINQIREFKASIVDPSGICPTKSDNGETLSTFKKEKQEFKEADVNINTNHQVVQIGGVKKPANLAADSLIASSKM